MAKQISQPYRLFKLSCIDKSNDAIRFRIISWNIEGLKRNSYNLHHFATMYNPLLVFLSEPQIFTCDIDHIMTIFSSYRFKLNSPDSFDLNLPLDKMKPRGGTMIMWHLSIDQYVTPLDPPSSSVLPILISLPGAQKACHICVYFPTAGLED